MMGKESEVISSHHSQGHSQRFVAYHVVSLSRLHPLVPVHARIERTSRSEQRSSPSTLNRLLESTFSLSNRVTQSENDGLLVIFGHSVQNSLGESSTDGRESEKSGGLDVLNDGEKSAEFGGGGILSGEVLLVFGEYISTVVGYESLYITFFIGICCKKGGCVQK